MKLGSNLSGIDYYDPERPFLNILKTGGGWFGDVNDGSGTHYTQSQFSFDLDANGYPKTLNGIGPAAGYSFTNSTYPGIYALINSNSNFPFYKSGTYVFLYEGTGTFLFQGDMAYVSGAGTGRIILSCTASAAGFYLIVLSTGSGSSYANNFRLVYSPDSSAGTGAGTVIGTNGLGTREALLNSGEIFDPVWISKIQEFKTVRFMDWIQALSNVQTAWADRAVLTQMFWGIQQNSSALDPIPQGVPIEAMVALCNEIGADGWFNMPLFATDDYVTQFATLVAGTLQAPLKAYVEYGDEIWNNNQIPAFSSLVTLGETFFPSAEDTYHGAIYYGYLRAMQMHTLWKAAFGSQSARVVRVLAGQGGANGTGNVNDVLLNLAPGSNGSSTSYWTTYGLSATNTANMNADIFATSAYVFLGGLTAPDTFSLDDVFIEIYDGGLISGDGNIGLLQSCLNNIASDYTKATSLGLPLVVYEFGQSLSDNTYEDLYTQALYSAANRDPRMGMVYTAFMNGISSAGVGLALNFSDIYQNGEPLSGTQPYYWGLWENVLEAHSPKADAILQFLNPNRRGLNVRGGF